MNTMTTFPFNIFPDREEPARLIRRRFDGELAELLSLLRRRDKPISEIKELMPLLTDSDPERVKSELRRILNG